MDRASPIIVPPQLATLAAPGSQHEVPDNLRDKLALLSDGTLLVSESYIRDMHVAAYRDSLRRNGVAYTVRPSSFEEIKALYGSDATGTRFRDVSPVQAKILDLMLEASLEGASDIHFVIHENETLVRWRVHNILKTRHWLTTDDGVSICRALFESMTDVSEPVYSPENSQYARVSKKWVERVGLQGARIATRPKEYGNLLVMRLFRLPEQDTVTTLETAGYTAVQCAQLHHLLRRKGIVLFSGETGSGKSSSLAILMRHLLKLFNMQIHLLTVENPVEKIIIGAVQTILSGDLNTPEGVSKAWAQAIANAVRLDLDYLMVGELQDHASAVAAISGALTGHGLFSTIHADDVFAILDRLFDWGIHARRLANPKLFSGLVNQALAPILCPTCRQPFHGAKDQLDEVTRERVLEFCTPDTVFVRGNDDECPTCNGLGVVDRRVVAEVCVTNHSLLNLYHEEGAANARKYWIQHMDGFTKCAHVTARINAGELDPFDGDSIVPLDDNKIILG